MSIEGNILIVDDNISNLKTLEELLTLSGHRVRCASNGSSALLLAHAWNPELILCDVRMPEMNGYTLCQKFKADAALKDIPVVFLSGAADIEDKLSGFKVGGVDYILKPFSIEEMRVRIQTHLKLFRLQRDLQTAYDSVELKIRERTQELRQTLVKLDKANADLLKSHIETIYRLTLAAEYKDKDTGHHIRRISQYAQVIGEALGLDTDFIRIMFHAAPMHDIGKVGIPEEILFKNGSLNQDGWNIMTEHTTIGAHILANSSSPFLKMAETIAMSHHENWDGSGYPQKLKGKDIPLAARIIKVADIYDALRSHRPYKEPFDHDKARQVIEQGDGRVLQKHLDPQVKDVFSNEHEKFREIFDLDAIHFKEPVYPN
jgi:putative two-component system response regulator